MGQLWDSPCLLPSLSQGAPSYIDCYPLSETSPGLLMWTTEFAIWARLSGFSVLCSPRLPNWQSSKRMGCPFCGGYFIPLSPRKPGHEGDRGINKQNPLKNWKTAFCSRKGIYIKITVNFLQMLVGFPLRLLLLLFCFVLFVLFCFNKKSQRRCQRTRFE